MSNNRNIQDHIAHLEARIRALTDANKKLTTRNGVLEREAEEAQAAAQVETFQAVTGEGVLYEGTDMATAVTTARNLHWATRRPTAVYNLQTNQCIWDSARHGGVRRPRRPS